MHAPRWERPQTAPHGAGKHPCGCLTATACTSQPSPAANCICPQHFCGQVQVHLAPTAAVLAPSKACAVLRQADACWPRVSGPRRRARLILQRLDARAGRLAPAAWRKHRGNPAAQSRAAAGRLVRRAALRLRACQRHRLLLPQRALQRLRVAGGRLCVMTAHCRRRPSCAAAAASAAPCQAHGAPTLRAH